MPDLALGVGRLNPETLHHRRNAIPSPGRADQAGSPNAAEDGREEVLADGQRQGKALGLAVLSQVHDAAPDGVGIRREPELLAAHEQLALVE